MEHPSLLSDLAVCGALLGLVCCHFAQKKRIDDFEARLNDAVAVRVVADGRSGTDKHAVGDVLGVFGEAVRGDDGQSPHAEGARPVVRDGDVVLRAERAAVADEDRTRAESREQTRDAAQDRVKRGDGGTDERADLNEVHEADYTKKEAR